MRHWVAWNILFRLHEFAKGHKTYRFLREMEAADRLSAAALEQLREARLRELIEYCYAHVPFVTETMREQGISPAQIRTVADLMLLPVMSKDDLRKHRSRLRSYVGVGLQQLATSGSTGEPLICDISKRRVAARVACRQRVLRWWGLSVGDPEIALWGSPIELSTQHRLKELRDCLLASRLLSAFEMDQPTMSRYLDILEDRPWRQIFAYPSAIYLLCLEAERQGRDLRQVGVKTVFVTGEVLLPYQRELISATLGCPVADGYGGRDSGFIAHECPQGGMHILADCTIVEVLGADGQPVPAGETGEITVTDLYSHEAPFLRYRTGDLGAMSPRQCSCGRALPLLERIEGRANDLIMAPDGRIINSLALMYGIREIDGVECFRIRQRQLDWFHVQVVRGVGYPEDAEARIRRSWTGLLRAPITVTFEYPQHLPVEHSGKFRHVVCDMESNAGARASDGPTALAGPARG
jgi:phenylacetate-CoA ligase